MTVWTIVLFLHVLAVAGLIGGMLFLGLIAVPAVRAHGGVQASRALVTSIGRKYGIMGGVSWVFILATGLLMMEHRGVSFADAGDSDYVRKLAEKLTLLILIGIAVLVHSFWQAPKIRQAEEADDEAARKRWRRVGAVLDGGMLLAALGALLIAASLRM